MSSTAVAALPPIVGTFSLTKHARARMTTRAISRIAVEAALEFGRCIEIRGAQIFAIGRREVERFRREGVELGDFEGTQVVVTGGGAVLTVYRNSDFRGLRDRRRGSAWR
ncbi:MAG: DUF4258 domain-containing protein [Polyangiaceae bacterium]|nr:DUF4258 domain-containing protein [Polyangiaceae bacterium]